MKIIEILYYAKAIKEKVESLKIQHAFNTLEKYNNPVNIDLNTRFYLQDKLYKIKGYSISQYNGRCEININGSDI